MSKLYIFDFDGTVSDTSRDIAASVNLTAKHFKAPEKPGEEIVRFLGYGALFLLRHTVEGFDGFSPEKQQEVYRYYVDTYYEHCVDTSVPYPGVRETLKALRLRGDRVTMFTNKPLRVTEKSLRAMGIFDLFEGVFCPENLAEKKPAPDGIFRSMELTGIPAEDTRMVGDSKADIDAAKAAGVRSLGCLFGLGDREKLLDAGPDRLIGAFPELLKD